MDEELLSLPTRRRLYEAVRRNPGVGARQLQRAAGTGWGETVYHLDRLTAAGLLDRERAVHQDHYYVRSVPGADRPLLSVCRSPSARRLLLALLERPGATVPELGGATGLSPGRLSVHLRRLVATGVLSAGRRGRYRTFAVVDPDRVVRVLTSYRESFADAWVERLLETWAELFRT